MENKPTAPRRVVVGNNKNGKSAILFYSVNPHQHNRGGGSTIYFNEIWTFENCPIDLSDHADSANRAMSHSPPENGAHFRVIQSDLENTNIIDQKSADDFFASMNVTGLSEKMDSKKHWNMHRTRTVDYGVVTKGSRIHVLPDKEIVMNRGDTVVQLGHFHSWDSSLGENEMLFIMIGGDKYGD